MLQQIFFLDEAGYNVYCAVGHPTLRLERGGSELVHAQVSTV